MEIAVLQEQGRVPVTVLRVTGEINAATYEQFQQQAQQAIQAGTRHILLDLAGVPYMSSAGLRALNQVYNWLNEQAPAGSEQGVSAGLMSGTFQSPYLKLLNPTPRVFQVLQVGGFDMFLGIFKNRQEAVNSF